MSDQEPDQRRALSGRSVVWFAKILAIYTAIALNFATQTYLLQLGRGGSMPWLRAFLGVAPIWYSWALVTPLIVLLARRFRFEPGRWPRTLLAHALGVLLVAPLQVGLMFGGELAVVAAWPLQLTLDQLLASAGRFFLANGIDVIQMYPVIAGISYTIDYYRMVRERELRERELETRLAQAQLQALRMQLHPHFLFNTLNAISTLLHRDPEAADRMVVLLADLLRSSLDSGPGHEVSLQEELDLLGRYVEIEQVRFSDRLRVRFEIEPDTVSAAVPKLILQPLVENALRHGIAPRSQPGEVRIGARASDGVLHLRVRDNGVGLARASRGQPVEGLGLTNARERLRQLYGEAARLDLVEPEGGGVEVIVTMPFRRIEGAVPVVGRRLAEVGRL